jgi:AcrR family transcriptional regulator
MVGSEDERATAEARGSATRLRTRRYEARRNAIVASAVSEINAKGVRGMTLGDVAARLDLVPTGVIYYFRNKEELAAACFLEAVARYDSLIAEAEVGGDDGARVRALVRAFVEYKRQTQLGEADHIATFNDARAHGSPEFGLAFVAMFRRARALLQGSPETPLPRLHRSARAHLLMSQLFWAPSWLRELHVDDFRRAGSRMADVLVDGLLAAGAAWPERVTLSASEAAPAPQPDDDPFVGAATELLNDEGYHGASVERISARLKVSKGAFYHHNASKDELVGACFQRTFDAVRAAIFRAEAAGGQGADVLVRTCVELVAHQLGPRAPLLRPSAVFTVPAPLQAPLRADLDRLSGRLASIICDGVADGSLRPVDVNVAAQLVMGMINAATELRHWAPDLPPEATAQHYVRPLFEGLVSPPAR